jgi:tetratricopeptide (TPR) repeat protein
MLEPIVDATLERVGADREHYLSSLDAETRRDVERFLELGSRPLALIEGTAFNDFAPLLADGGTPPAVLGGRYELGRIVGRGGMATVYLARDVRHGRDVAVKVLHPGVSALVTRERFLTEIAIVAKLTHPHILPLHDSGESDGFLYYVMPYVDGQSLRDRLLREKRLSRDEAVRIAREIGAALGCAHAAGIVHRDVKPENILFVDGHAVLCDFGIAQAVSAVSADERSPIVGTPVYMSPEQTRRNGHINQRSDVYSLGVVMYEMLGGDPATRLAATERRGSTAVVSDGLPGISRRTARVLGRAMAVSPAHRYATVDEFTSALEATVARPSRAALTLSVVASLAALGAVTLVARPFADATSGTAAGERTASARPPSARGGQPRPEALESYLNGVTFLTRRTAQDRLRALAAFRRAIELDPTFAAAHARVAQTYALLGYFGYPGGPPVRVAFSDAERALRDAFRLDSDSPEAYLALATLRWMHHPDIRASQRAIEMALVLSPDFAEARFEHARVLAIRQQADSAIAEVRKARELEPGTSVRYADVAWVQWIVRHYDDAIGGARAAIQVDSTSSTPYLALGGALAARHQYDSAIVAFEQGLRKSGGNRFFLPELGYAYAAAGDTAKARSILRELGKLYSAGNVSAYYVAEVHAGLGERDSALTWLERASENGAGHLSFLRANSAWDALRAEPRFQAIVKRVGLD